MDKQPFDHIENRIRQAADEISVSFNEEAWKKMEIKLDNEFNKDRRRGIIWWWFSFMMIGIAALGIYLYHPGLSKEISISSSLVNQSSKSKNNNRTTSGPNDHKTPTASLPLQSTLDHGKNQKEEKNNLLNESTANLKEHLQTLKENNHQGLVETADNLKKTSDHTLTKQSASDISSSKSKTIKKIKSDGLRSLTQHNTSVKPPESQKTFTPSFKAINDKKINSKTAPGSLSKNKFNQSKDTLADKNNGNNDKQTAVNDNQLNKPSKTTQKPDTDSTSSVASKENLKATDSVTRKDNITGTDSASKKNVKIKLTTPSSKGIYFLASVAGEATGIKEISIKDTKPIYGVGVGYQFNKKLSVQTGFYFGKKVYYAGPDDYKVKPGSYIAKIISAEAECYIYDIPLNVRYDAIHKSNSNFYLTTGLSSYILKRETYDIHFFNPMGTYRHMPYTYKNNVGYFSVLNFSAGYEHKLSRSLFMQAEPYIKLPLTGLGEGKAKLFSAGLQLGIKYQPSKKKK